MQQDDENQLGSRLRPTQKGAYFCDFSFLSISW